MSEELTMESLFNQFAQSGLTEEANRFRTVPRGPYTIQITKADPRLTKPDTTDPSKVQRPYAHFTASVLTPEGKRQSTIFFNASWVIGRRETTGKLDGMSKLWGQIEKAFNVVGKSVADVLAETVKFPARAFVDVVYRDQAGNRYYLQSNGVSDADQEKQYLTLGYEPENTVLSIGAVK